MNTKSGCENRAPLLYCNSGQTIVNGTLKFGRWDNKICLKPSVTLKTPPQWSLYPIPTRCAGKRTCQLNPLMTEFGEDPYEGVFKHFFVNYTCY